MQIRAVSCGLYFFQMKEKTRLISAPVFWYLWVRILINTIMLNLSNNKSLSTFKTLCLALTGILPAKLVFHNLKIQLIINQLQ